MATDVKIQETINQLKAIDIVGGSYENLSEICSVLYEPDFGWTQSACGMLRDVLVGMLEQYDPADWSNEYLAEVGLVRLPKDVDGVPVHVGDKMVLADGGEPFEVEAIGEDLLWFYDEDLQEHHNWASYECRHYKTTVEDVLWELLCTVDKEMFDDDARLIVRKYANRLREMMDSDK